MKSGFIPVSTIIARVIVAGVGHPVGVFGLPVVLVIAPSVISSASRLGVRSVFSGPGPAPGDARHGGENGVGEDGGKEGRS